MLRSPSRFVRTFITAAVVGSLLAGCGSSADEPTSAGRAAEPAAGTEVTFVSSRFSQPYLNR
jgi:iron complex transport system substrate-binding protein